MPGHKLWSCGLILLGDLFVLLIQYFIKFPAKSLGWAQAPWFTIVCTTPYCGSSSAAPRVPLGCVILALSLPGPVQTMCVVDPGLCTYCSPN